MEAESPDLTPDARALMEAMSDISEDRWCAGWLTGLEYCLWQAITTDGVPQDGMRGAPLTAAAVARLWMLAYRAGGWIRWADGEVFVPFAEWESLYAAHMNWRDPSEWGAWPDMVTVDGRVFPRQTGPAALQNCAAVAVSYGDGRILCPVYVTPAEFPITSALIERKIRFAHATLRDLMAR